MKDFKKLPKMKTGGKVKKFEEGGSAFVGTRLNLPSNTRLGKLSASDTRQLNKQDASPEGQRAKFERRHAIPSSATAEERSGATPGTEELQYIKRGGRIAKKVGKVKKYADGKSVLADKLLNNTEDLDKKVNSRTSGGNYVIRSEELNKKLEAPKGTQAQAIPLGKTEPVEMPIKPMGNGAGTFLKRGGKITKKKK
jgi:hypothetical protein